MPTVLEACGVPVPDRLEGRSFLPLLEGKEHQECDAVFGALYYDAAYNPMHFERTHSPLLNGHVSPDLSSTHNQVRQPKA